MTSEPLQTADADPRWSPTGRLIVFTRGHNNSSGDFSIRWVEPSTGRGGALTSGGGHWDREPVWSPDGKTVAFVRSSDSLFCNEDDRVLTLSAPPRKTTAPEVVGLGCQPAWSPDGSAIAFLRHDSLVVSTRNEAHEVVVAASVPSRFKWGVNVPGEVFDFDWSPDGARLAFERGNEIWIVDANGGNAHRITEGGRGRAAHTPRWSPDGALILHTRTDYGTAGLWIMRPDGRDAYAIAPGDVDEELYGWSPDGTRILFSRNATFLVADRQGTIHRRFPSMGSFGSFGGWAPDGKHVVFGGDTRGSLSNHPQQIVSIDVETGRAKQLTQQTSGTD